MLEILFIWLAIGLFALTWGDVVCQVLGKTLFPEISVSIWLRFWTGMAFLSFVMGLMVFLSPLTPVVKFVLWLGFASPLFLKRQYFQRILLDAGLALSNLGWPGTLLVMLSGGIALLKANGLPEIFDEGAYHLPLIRMWEREGLVIGMANLNGHYGLNSTWHILSAFSNPDFIPGWQSEMALNGLVALVLALFSGSRLTKVIKGSRNPGHLLASLYPFFVFRNLLSSPSTDIPAIICTWFVLALWLETLWAEEDVWRQWPAFLILPVWIVVLKTSSAALLLIPACFAVLAWLEGQHLRWKRTIFWSLCLGLPWLVQNWLISGYLVFPIKATALGNPEWQVPVSAIEKKFYLAQFRDFAPPTEYTWSWFKGWFSAHNADSRVIIGLAFFTLVIGFLAITFSPRLRNQVVVFLYFSLVASLLSWFLTITEPRYGFGTLVFSALLLPCWLASLAIQKLPWLRFGFCAILVLQGYNLWKTGKESPLSLETIAKPAASPQVAWRTLQCGNFEAVVPVKYETQVPKGKPVFCWDCPYPCVPWEGRSDSSALFRHKKGLFTIYRFQEPVQ